MKIKEAYYGVIFKDSDTPNKVSIAFSEGGGPMLYQKRKSALTFKRKLIEAGCNKKRTKVVKIKVTMEIEP